MEVEVLSPHNLWVYFYVTKKRCRFQLWILFWNVGGKGRYIAFDERIRCLHSWAMWNVFRVPIKHIYWASILVYLKHRWESPVPCRHRRPRKSHCCECPAVSPRSPYGHYRHVQIAETVDPRYAVQGHPKCRRAPMGGCHNWRLPAQPRPPWLSPQSLTWRPYVESLEPEQTRWIWHFCRRRCGSMSRRDLVTSGYSDCYGSGRHAAGIHRSNRCSRWPALHRSGPRPATHPNRQTASLLVHVRVRVSSFFLSKSIRSWFAGKCVA